MKNIANPNPLHYALYYEKYIALVSLSKESVLDQLKNNGKRFEQILKSLPEDQLLFRYAEGKWCIKDIIQHIVDTEKLFTYRGMVFLRGDKTPQLWMDEDAWAAEADAAKKPLSKILKEYKTVRAASIAFYNSMSSKEFKKFGVATNFEMSVAATAYITCGHELHHWNVIQEKYLK
jgi:uncharacterized damage-inducible protein DinB